MLRTCVVHICGLALLLGVPAVALCQNPYSSGNSYNGFSSSGGSSLNQIALRNAQALMMQSLQQPNSGMSSAGRIGLGLDQSYSGTKPFSGYSLGPTVSPYLNLFRTDLSGNSGNNYSTLVEPQLRQQQFQQQQQRQNVQTSRRLQSIAAEVAYSPQGSRELAPTGHQTVFSYLGSFYPPARSHAKKRSQY